MPVFTTPSDDPLAEFNACHKPKGPAGGQFCAATGSLPEAPERYFLLDKNTVSIPLRELQTIRYRPGNRAEQFMADALAGQGEKRKPITVQWAAGKYRVLDGNSTVAVARKHGWRTIPAHVVQREELREFNACHRPKGPQGGQFCSDAPASFSTSPIEAVAPRVGDTYARPTPKKVADLDEAVARILKGEVVELTDVRAVNTVLTKLAAMAQDAQARGENAPSYNLCLVSVRGTNLFCASKVTSERFPEGIPRIKMPQFGGLAEPGSPADRLPKGESGTVDSAPAFLDHLADLGIKTERTTVKAAALKASQRELVGPQVAGMMAAMTTERLTKTPIFVSRDNYVIDGHHRWAAIVGRDSEDGTLNLDMLVIRVDAPISEILPLARKWTKAFGIRPKEGEAPAPSRLRVYPSAVTRTPGESSRARRWQEYRDALRSRVDTVRSKWR